MLTHYAKQQGQNFITGLSTDTKPVSPEPDWVFLESDTGITYKVVAGAWEANASGGGGSDPLALHKAGAETVTGAKTFNADTFLDKGSEVYNVKAYGALGDGATDDYAAFVATFAAISASGGKVFIPPGVYMISNIITITNSDLEIEFAPGAILKASESLDDDPKDEYRGLLHFSKHATGGTQHNVYVHGGTIDCNNQAETNALSIWGSGGNAGAGIIQTNTTSNFLIEDMKFINKGNSTNATSIVMLQGSEVGAVTMGTVKDITFRNCTIDGVDMDGISWFGDYFENILFDECKFYNIDHHTAVQFGYLTRTNRDFRFHKCQFKHTKLVESGFSVSDIHDANRTGGFNFFVEQCIFSNEDDSIVTDALAINLHGWHNIYIDNNTFTELWTAISLGQSQAGSAWHQDGCTEVWITDNTFDKIRWAPFDNDASYRLHIKGNTFKEIALFGFGFYSKHEWTFLEDNLFYNCNAKVEDAQYFIDAGVTLEEYMKSAIDLGGSDRVFVRNNTVVDDRALINPGASGATFSQAAGGALAGRTYYVRISYANETGETLASTEESYAVSASNLITIKPGIPAGYATTYSSIGGIRQIKIYVGASAGTATLQATQDYPDYDFIVNGWTEPTTGLISGAALPGANTTHGLTKYGIYHLDGYVGAGPNYYIGNKFFGVTDTPIISAGTDSAIQYDNYSDDVRLDDVNAGTAYEPEKGADDNYVTDAEKVKLSNLSGTNTGDDTNFAPPLGGDDNYVTDAEKVKLSNLSGTNTGDQTSIVGITGTIAQFNAAVTDADFATLAGTETLTNKRITQRVVTTADDSTAVIDVDITDQYQLTAMANATTISTSGTPTAGQKLIIRLKDNGTARALTWDAIFRAIGVTLPTTTIISKTVYIGCIYNLTDTKWDAVAVSVQA